MRSEKSSPSSEVTSQAAPSAKSKPTQGVLDV
jgi:hypothetical protein